MSQAADNARIAQITQQRTLRVDIDNCLTLLHLLHDRARDEAGEGVLYQLGWIDQVMQECRQRIAAYLALSQRTREEAQ